MLKEWVMPVQVALKKRGNTSKVKITKAWKALVDEYDIGIKMGNYLELSTSDFDRLQTILNHFMQCDHAAFLDTSKTRAQIAALTPEEKTSSARAFSLVRLAPSDGYITLSELVTRQHQSVQVLAGTLLSVTLEQLNLETDNFKSIIIIENGATIEQWWDIVPLLPVELQTNALFIYRGHGNEQKRILKRLAQIQSPSTTLYFFGDYDPSGIEIGMTTMYRRLPNTAFAIIAPAERAGVTARMSKPDTFNKQKGALTRLERRTDLAPAIKELVTHMRDNKLAVTQEVLVARGVGLAVYMQRAINPAQPTRYRNQHNRCAPLA